MFKRWKDPKDSRKEMAILSEPDFLKYKEQKRLIDDHLKVLSMLNSCHKQFLWNIREKYKLPEKIQIDLETGKVYKIEDGD